MAAAALDLDSEGEGGVVADFDDFAEALMRLDRNDKSSGMRRGVTLAARGVISTLISLPSGSSRGSVRYIVFWTGAVVEKACRRAGFMGAFLMRVALPQSVLVREGKCCDVRLELKDLEARG